MKNTINILKKLIFLIALIVGYQVYTYYFDINSNETTVDLRETINTNDTPTISEINQSSFQIYFLDVGEADSILIQNNGEYSLVDAGNNEDGKLLVSFFHQLGINSFKYVIGTHAHEDHIGGMDNIIDNFSIEHFFMPDVITKSKCFEDVITSLNKKGIIFETPDIDSTFTMADTKFKVIWISKNEEDLNDTSIILKVINNKKSFLLTGDATSNVERQILDKDLESDLLKVGHHGSRGSTSAHFLRKVNPKYAVISVGANNDYGHPNNVILQKLERIGANIYRTDLDGSIIVSIDQDNISIQKLKTNLNGNN